MSPTRGADLRSAGQPDAHERPFRPPRPRAGPSRRWYGSLMVPAPVIAGFGDARGQEFVHVGVVERRQQGRQHRTRPGDGGGQGRSPAQSEECNLSLVRPVDPVGLEVEEQEYRQSEADDVVLHGPGQAPLTGQAFWDRREGCP